MFRYEAPAYPKDVPIVFVEALLVFIDRYLTNLLIYTEVAITRIRIPRKLVLHIVHCAVECTAAATAKGTALTAAVHKLLRHTVTGSYSRK